MLRLKLILSYTISFDRGLLLIVKWIISKQFRRIVTQKEWIQEPL